MGRIELLEEGPAQVFVCSCVVCFLFSEIQPRTEASAVLLKSPVSIVKFFTVGSLPGVSRLWVKGTEWSKTSDAQLI